MGRGWAVVVLLIASVTATAFVPFTVTDRPSPNDHPDPANATRIWEAWAKGIVEIEQVDITSGLPVGYEVRNLGGRDVLIDEYVMILNPNPVAGPFGTGSTQDGVLHFATVAGGSSYMYTYGELVLDGTFPGQPIWYCTEAHQFTRPDTLVALGGEILPFNFEDWVANNYYVSNSDNSQASIWNELALHPAVVVGKTPLWRSITDRAGQALQVRLSATNIAVDEAGRSEPVDAIGAHVIDTVPAGWTYDPASFSLAPSLITNNADGTTSLEWTVDLDAPDVAGHDNSQPPAYGNVQITYDLGTPALTAGRLYLPRAQVDEDADGTIDAHSAEPLLEIAQSNRAPSLLAKAATGVEGFPAVLKALASDPDGDALTFSFDFENDGIWDAVGLSAPLQLHTWGDDYTGEVRIAATDGEFTVESVAPVTVLNAPPNVPNALPTATFEGSTLTLDFRLTDPGSDDLSAVIDWADGTTDSFTSQLGPAPDAPGSTDINPRDVSSVATHVFGDNALLGGFITATDDDGGSFVLSVHFTITNSAPTVTLSSSSPRPISNLAPPAPPRGVGAGVEGSPVTLTATATDPGSDDLEFFWDWNDGTSESFTYFNDGVGPDPHPSVGGTFPFTATDVRAHTWGDDGDFTVTVTVTDDDGGQVQVSLTVQVENVAPTLDVQAYVPAQVTLRVAGEKWHDVCVSLVDSGHTTASACVVRTPGSPDRQTKTISGGRINVFGDTGIVVFYTPADDPINGQPNGDNPVWIILTFADGSSTRLFHNFNVQHPGTWVWTLDDLLPALLGKDITFDMTASDPGSDDLTFSIDFGDGSAFSETVFNDGVAADPHPSPDIRPITATASTQHAYGVAGTYTVTFQVTDDDGGSTSQTDTFTVG